MSKVPASATTALIDSIMSLKTSCYEGFDSAAWDGYERGFKAAQKEVVALIGGGAALPVVPEGWKLVPIVPTVEMMDCAFDNISLSDAHTTYGVTEHVWDYMISHAPALPVEVPSQPQDQPSPIAEPDTAIQAPSDETLRDAIAEGLRGLYGCGRVWSAWNVGTMSEDDFYPAEESDECISQMLDAIQSHLKGE